MFIFTVLEATLDTITISRKEYDRLLNIEAQLLELQRIVYGSKSERFIGSENPQQLSLDDPEGHQEIAASQAESEQEISYKRKRGKQEKPTRKGLPEHLPRHIVTIEPDHLSEDAVKIGEEVCETYEYEPGKLSVKRTVRPKYVQTRAGHLSSPNEQGKKEIVIAPAAKVAFPKSSLGNSLAAYILVSKYVDHLPIHRQRQIFSRENISLSASTIDGWLALTAKVLAPLYQLLLRQVQSVHYIQADESTIKVKIDREEKAKRKKKNHQITGYYWVLHAVEEKLVVFHYYHSRAGECALELLENFTGILQCDGYRAYDQLAGKEDITPLGCMAHVRRYFEKALATDKPLAGHAMKVIQSLYEIEDDLQEKAADPTTIEKNRIEKAKPILDDWKKWLLDTRASIIPKVRKEDKLLVAINYTLARWEKVVGYIKVGKALIDNNAIENKIRPLALGRKNYLFAGSHNGAIRGAMMYSFFACCKLNNVNPTIWLNHVFDQITKINPDNENQLRELLPNNCSICDP